MTDPQSRAQREPSVSPGGMEIFERDMTATIAADLPLEAAQARLAECGQWLPIDGDPKSAVGELVEINSTGPLRLGYGAWRDLLLGCQFINGRGELITAGGRAIKNVAGYDLTKLMVGQQGLLGKIVTITTRTHRLPKARLTAWMPPDMRTLNALLPTACRPQWTVMDANGMACGYLGDEAMIEFIADRINAFGPVRISREEGGEAREAFSRRFEPGVTFRASVPPTRLMEFTANDGLLDWVADPVFGIARGHCPEKTLPRLRLAVKALSGSLWRERGETIGDFADSPAQGALLGRLSAAFGKP